MTMIMMMFMTIEDKGNGNSILGYIILFFAIHLQGFR